MASITITVLVTDTELAMRDLLKDREHALADLTDTMVYAMGLNYLASLSGTSWRTAAAIAELRR